jgi:hypothetical protein
LPPAIHRQQALSAAWTNFTAQFCLTFGGHFIDPNCGWISVPFLLATTG